MERIYALTSAPRGGIHPGSLCSGTGNLELLPAETSGFPDAIAAKWRRVVEDTPPGSQARLIRDSYYRKLTRDHTAELKP